MSCKWLLFLAVFLIGGCVTVGGEAVSDQVPRISVEDLKARLGSPDVVVLDVRNEWTWNSSNMKIAGAVREDPRLFFRWYDKYPKDKALVLYCT